MKRLTDKKGMTLIEVIVAFAILAMIISVFFSLFANSYQSIINSGRKTKAKNLARQSLEDRILTGATTTSSSVVLSIDGVTAITVEGEMVTTSSAVNGQNVDLTMFLPK